MTYKTILKNLTPRKYQEDIYQVCKDKNSLVVLPTGLGKCIEYSEPILFADGTIKEIGKYFEEEKSNGKILDFNSNRISIKPSNTKRVASIDDNMKIVEQKILAIHKIKATKPLIEIESYSGIKIKVTPEHPFLSLNNKLEWKPADKFIEGDFIAVPSKIPEPSNINKIDIIKVFSNINFNVNCYVNLKKKFYLKYGLNKEERLKDLINLKINLSELKGSIISFIIKGCRSSNHKLKKIEKFTPEMMYWVGLVIGEARVGGGVNFYNTDPTLLRLFKKLSFDIFGVKTSSRRGGLKASSTALYYFIRNLFGLKTNQHSRDKTISDTIMQLDNKHISKLLSGLYDSEGSVDPISGTIEFSSASKELINRISYLLLRFGIKSRTHEKQACATNSKHPKIRTYYRLNIGGGKDLKIFQEKIGFQHKERKLKLDKFLQKQLKYNPNFNLIPISGQYIRSIRESLKLSSTKWKDFNIPGIDTYEREERIFSHETLRKAIEGFKKVKKRSKLINMKIDFLEKLLHGDIYWDKIKKITKSNEDWVYDISLEKNFNFIAGRNGGFIVHNTLIALMLAEDRLKAFSGSKCLILAPTRPLCEQHLKYFQTNMPSEIVPMEKMVLFTGKIKSEKRAEIWKKARIIISTPQCSEKDLEKGLYDLKDVGMLCIDEAHKCIDNYAYNSVVKTYKKQALNPRILALTASPGASLGKIDIIAHNLEIDAIEIRTQTSPDVIPYVQQLDSKLVSLELPDSFNIIKNSLQAIFDRKIEELKKNGLLKKPATKTFILECQRELSRKISSGERNSLNFMGVMACACAMKIQHALELLETQTLFGLNNYLEGLKKAAAAHETKTVVALVGQPEFSTALTSLTDLVNKKIENPKLQKLKEIVTEEILKDPKMKIIVFAQFRDTVSTINKELNTIQGIKSKVFVGQAKKGEGDNQTGSSQKEQQEIVQEFSKGSINVISCSQIAEEGLDIPSVSMVIFYEPIPSAIRTVQRRGRCARLESGKLRILMVSNTRDETYHWSSQKKEKAMYDAIEVIKKQMDNGTFHKNDDSTPEKDSQIDSSKWEEVGR